jgi:hypothetical protein
MSPNPDNLPPFPPHYETRGEKLHKKQISDLEKTSILRLYYLESPKFINKTQRKVLKENNFSSLPNITQMDSDFFIKEVKNKIGSIKNFKEKNNQVKQMIRNLSNFQSVIK